MARIIILTEGHTDPLSAKTAASVIRYRRAEVVAILDSTSAGRTSQELLHVGGDIPVVGSLADGPAADTLLIGIAPSGGKMPPPWRTTILDAIARGMSIVSGLHDFLSNDAELAAAAARGGVELVDLRKNCERDVATQQGIRAECLRILTVGNDCSVGKMVAAIETVRGLQAAGHDAKFLATGQTGIMIEGDGCPVDCVVADFLNGAAERLVRAHQHHEIVVIEGQGSLYHPSFSAVTLGLLHGTMPDGLVLCFEAGRRTARGLDHVRLPGLAEAKSLYEAVASVMHPCQVIAVAMNGRSLPEQEADARAGALEHELGVPVCDVLRNGPGRLIDAVLSLRAELGKNS